MPRLNVNFARCVFFLHGRHPATGKLSKPVGTGVLIGTGGPRLAHGNMYAVTCAHTAPQGASIIRINTNDGGSRTIDLHPDDWFTAKHNGADIAAADITEKISPDDDIRYITASWFVTKSFIQSAEIGIGEDGFMLGLFTEQPGSRRNLVASKFGNITLLADDDAPIGWKGRRPIPAHLFDIRSRGGFSGSPVFIYRTPNGDLTDVTEGRRRRTTLPPRTSSMRWPDHDGRDHELKDWEFEHDIADNLFIRLLGIHVAQFKEPVEVSKVVGSVHSEAPIEAGDKLWIEGGVTIVVPAWDVLELLNRDEFVQQRQRREDRRAGDRPGGRQE